MCSHSWRERKTGPGHKLRIIECKRHGVFFTVYPPGFAPYLRRSVDPATPNSLFSAAKDAASGQRAWRRRSRGGRKGPCWSSQGRLIALVAQLLGLHALCGDADHVCQDLGVALHVHRAARADFAAARGYRDRGAAVIAVLERVEAPVVPRLQRAGEQVGRWGRAWRVAADGCFR